MIICITALFGNKMWVAAVLEFNGIAYPFILITKEQLSTEASSGISAGCT